MNDKNHDNFSDEHSQDQQASQDLLQMINDFEHKPRKYKSRIQSFWNCLPDRFRVHICGYWWKNEAMIKKWN